MQRREFLAASAALATLPRFSETGGARLDSLDPDNFKYTITARELT
jgi:hypothetical protein